MRHQSCIAVCSIHVFAMAVCTYIAAIEIRSILITGWICSATGLAAGISAIACKRPILAIVGFAAPVIAVLLVALEKSYLHLGPYRAAQPFAVIFLMNQAIATPTILVHFSIASARASAVPKQITLRTLLVTMASFAVFFAIAPRLVDRPHDWLMASALGLLGLTLVGLSVLLYSAVANRTRPAPEKNDQGLGIDD